MTLEALVVILLFSMVAVVLISVQHNISIGIKDISTQMMCGAIYSIRGAATGGPLGVFGYGWRKIAGSIVPESPACGKIIVINSNRKNPQIANVTSPAIVNRRIASEINECWGKAERDPDETIQCVYLLKFRLNETGPIDECTITKTLGDTKNVQYKETWQSKEAPGNEDCDPACSCVSLSGMNPSQCAQWAPGGNKISGLECLSEKYDENTQNEYAIRIYYDGGGTKQIEIRRLK